MLLTGTLHGALQAPFLVAAPPLQVPNLCTLNPSNSSADMQVVNIGASGEAFEVRARGELQLGLLLGMSSVPDFSVRASSGLP